MAGVTKGGALVKVGEVALEQPKAQEARNNVPLPPILQQATLREAPGLSPTVRWSQVGEWFVGRFLGRRDGVGPNNSRLYSMSHYRTGEVIGVWGGTVLDRKMDALQPQHGTMLAIQYVADVKTSRQGGKPARDFLVAEVAAPQSGLKGPA